MKTLAVVIGNNEYYEGAKLNNAVMMLTLLLKPLSDLDMILYIKKTVK